MTPKPAQPMAHAVPVAGKPIPVDVVVHTHWDREWYMDRETTLARLETVMERVAADLDDGRLEQFLFDGQMVALEDLTTRADGELIRRLHAHARSGRLVLGPWYVASDEFLVSGESLLRNLAMGIELAQDLGGAQRVGYLPDTFGHVSQMPQILQQFGISHAVVWRGVDTTQECFDWRALDGSTVAAMYLSEGYYLHPLHGADWAEQTLEMLRRLRDRRQPPHDGPLLLPHGGDHLAPHPQLQARMKALNAKQSEFELRQCTLQAHAWHAGSPGIMRPVLDGELRSNARAFVLPDVLSTRRHLKRMHQATEDRILGQIEPLLAQLGANSTCHAALQRAWHVLLQQQAHDSICGCSTDEVHREMEQRFLELSSALDALQRRVLQRAGMVSFDRHGAADGHGLNPSASAPVPDVWADDSRFTLFNPLPRCREGWFEVELFLQGPRRTALQAVDEQGQGIPVEVMNVREDFELVSPLDEFPQRLDGHRYTVVLHQRMPGLGVRACTVLEGLASPPASTQHPPAARHMAGDFAPTDGLFDSGVWIDNGAWRAELDAKGRLVLTNLHQQPNQPRTLGVMSELDAGDTYNHSAPAGAPHHLGQAWTCSGIRREGALQELRLRIELDLPEGLNAARSSGSEHAVHCVGELTLCLLYNEDLLRLQLVWHNKARDQRTRLVFGGIAPQTSHTWRDTAFAWTAHPIRLSHVPPEIGRGEAPVSVQPSLSAVVAGPWMLVHRAMHEYEIIPDPFAVNGGDLALVLTLVRSVGWMSRRDLRTRGVGAGPDLPTPQAQCLHADQFDMMLVAQSPQDAPHEALRHAETLRRPLMALRGHTTEWGPELNLAGQGLQVSCCRRLADGRLEVRLWNATQEPVAVDLMRFPCKVVRADGQALNDQTGSANLTVAPHAMVTLHSTQPWSRR